MFSFVYTIDWLMFVTAFWCYWVHGYLL